MEMVKNSFFYCLVVRQNPFSGVIFSIFDVFCIFPVKKLLKNPDPGGLYVILYAGFVFLDDICIGNVLK